MEIGAMERTEALKYDVTRRKSSYRSQEESEEQERSQPPTPVGAVSPSLFPSRLSSAAEGERVSERIEQNDSSSFRRAWVNPDPEPSKSTMSNCETDSHASLVRMLNGSPCLDDTQ